MNKHSHQNHPHHHDKVAHGHEMTGHAGHSCCDMPEMSGHEGHMAQDFKTRFWISLVLSVPVVALSSVIQGWLKISFHFPGDSYLVFAISSVIFFYGGFPFLKGLV